MENDFFIIFDYVLHISLCHPVWYFIVDHLVFTSQIVLYILQSTVLFSFYIDEILTLFNRHASYNYKNTPRTQITTMPSLRSVNQAWNSLTKPSQLEKKNHGPRRWSIVHLSNNNFPLYHFRPIPNIPWKFVDPFSVMLLADTLLTTSSTYTHPATKKK